MAQLFNQKPNRTGITNEEAATHLGLNKNTFIKWKALLNDDGESQRMNKESLLYEMFMMIKFKELLESGVRWRTIYLSLLAKSKRNSIVPHKLIEQRFNEIYEINIKDEWEKWKAEKMPLIQQIREVNNLYIPT